MNHKCFTDCLQMLQGLQSLIDKKSNFAQRYRRMASGHLSYQGLLDRDISLLRKKKIWRVVCVFAKSLQYVWLLETPWTTACQAPRSMGFSRQEYWRGCHFLLQGIFRIKTTSPAWRAVSMPLGLPGKPLLVTTLWNPGGRETEPGWRRRSRISSPPDWWLRGNVFLHILQSGLLKTVLFH